MYKQPSLMEMLTYKRPEGSPSQYEFCERYLEPVMGEPDYWGNYILVVGDRPNIAFMAHHDTVHTTFGRQYVWKKEGKFYSNSNCLGADCTTGVWLILGMIEAGIPGVYVVHAGEEVGCVGSGAIAIEKPDWLLDLDACISFDRYGYDSVITHQMMQRTASDEFAVSLASILGMDMEPDPPGS